MHIVTNKTAPAFACAAGVLAAALLFSPLAAAPGAPGLPPLIGPLLVSETAAQDRLFIYDLGASPDPITALPPARTLQFGDQPVRAWEFMGGGCQLLLTLGAGGAADTTTRAYSAALDGALLADLAPGLPPDVALWEPQMQPGVDSAFARLAYTQVQRATPERASTLNTDAAANFTHRIAWVDANGATGFYSAAGDEHHPRWSPDGTHLAYIAYERAGNGAREADLWLTSADGAAKFRLTDFPAGSAGAPHWSPDGDLVAFVYAPDGLRDQFWMIGAQQGAIPTQLSYADLLALDFTWEPDGTALVAAAQDFRGNAESRLWRVPLVGSLDEAGAEVLPDAALGSQRAARFSADGRWLALRTGYTLTLVEVATGRWTRLDAPPANTTPLWSPAAFTGEGDC